MIRSAFVKMANNIRNLSSIPETCRIPKDRLAGKVAIVTASTDGIGYAIARRLAQEGAKVVISSRKEKNVQRAVSELKKEKLEVLGTVCHVSNTEDRKKLFEEANAKFGGVDIVISNAAANPAVGPVLECEEAAWDKTFDVNVKAAYLIAKESLPYLRKRGKGKIVFVSSIAGFQPLGLLGTYSVTKTALLGLTKCAASDLANENITVNCIAPGIIKTKFSAAITGNPSVEEKTLDMIPLGRFGTPDEIAGVAAFLVSDDASYITGETIIASGGMPSRL